MQQRFFAMCGLIAPLWFILVTILGGAMRPGYSHLSETISELFSPGSPNKLLLDTLHAVYALLLTLFGVGLVRLFWRSERARFIGTIGATMFTAMGLVSLATATVFPQDAWGSAPTFRGEMHKILHGIISILTILAMVLIGIWFHRAKGLSWFRTYSFFTVGLALLAAGWYMANQGTPIMGLTERIAALVGFQWVFVLALWIFSRTGDAG
jgi:hypothetical membrane protein